MYYNQDYDSKDGEDGEDDGDDEDDEDDEGDEDNEGDEVDNNNEDDEDDEDDDDDQDLCPGGQVHVPPGELQTPPCSQGGSQTTGKMLMIYIHWTIVCFHHLGHRHHPRRQTSPVIANH